MATNPPYGDNRRNGAVKERSQTYNPKTDKWVNVIRKRVSLWM